MSDIMHGLNDKQKEAVSQTEGPLLVLAGAGSGKTTVLTRRVANILEKGLAKPWQILAITFTNKAAAEMKERIAKLVPNSDDIWVRTFHSCCVRILRRDISSIGYESSFNIYDSNDQKRIVKDCIKECGLNEENYPVKSVLSIISDCKNKDISPEEFAKQSEKSYRERQLARLYQEYEIRLKRNNALDFDDLILKTVLLFKTCPDVLEYYQNKFKYILVDEYQDTNSCQYKLVEMLARNHRNLCVVGDDDQSIYKFRGADISNILDFEKFFTEAKVVKLEQNYRSTQNILTAANSVIKNNRMRKAKALWTNEGDGEKIVLRALNDQVSEAVYVNNQIEQLVSKEGYKYSDFAILYRTNAQTRAFEENLTCPYRILAGLRFYDRKEIKDILAYLRVLFNPNDDHNLTRIINVPKRSIGDSTVSKLQSYASTVGKSIYTVITDGSYVEILGRANTKISEFAELIQKLRDMVDKVSVTELIDELLTSTGYVSRLLLESPPDEALSRIENVEEFKSKAKEYEEKVENPSFEGFLDNISLVSDVDNYDENQNAVVLMTLHSAKGLEFPVVFMCGMENGLFPSFMSEMEEGGLEEERRLCYVGITRARKKLYFTYAKQRTLYGKTEARMRSPFINEVPPEYLDIEVKRQSGFNAVYSVSNSQKSSRLPSFSFTAGAKPSFSSVPGAMRGADLKTASGGNDIKKGDRVSHKKFGEGLVLSVSEVSGDFLYEISFENVGTRSLMASFAKLTKL
ncbi:MAG: UvrD-helicase domain-containing protein [Clostridia bacterium]|nr:UvrD-helicase domain-containing protein [Clostridia bacterium]MBO7288909.1 UvrD-helicase domain-containing protein [Clostridia bacterium]